MFERAAGKLEEATTLLDQLKVAKDTRSFRSLFNALINVLRAITNALQAEGKHIKGFTEWYKPRQQEMRTDELLRFIHDARVQDFHEGRHRLWFPSAHIKSYSTDSAGPPPAPNASLVIGTEGPSWIVDQGTSRERTIPVRHGGSWTVQVAIDNGPQVHKGRKLLRRDPVTICQLAIAYLQNLVYEAKSKYSSVQ